ncbi:MAG: DUF5317 family protein [Coriobacteriia bacterium]|nr:DUF5317 family protein [Coriobacteriia bacterium]
MILLEMVVLALVISLMAGGSLRKLEQERLRGEWLLLVLLPLQIAWPQFVEMMGMGCAISLTIWLLMMTLLVVVLALNAPHRWALGVAALGITLNVIVIGFNGAMPVSLRATSEIGVSRADALIKLDADCLHGVFDEGVRIPALADVIAIPGPRWQCSVVSVGDLLLALGLSSWVFTATHKHIG